MLWQPSGCVKSAARPPAGSVWRCLCAERSRDAGARGHRLRQRDPSADLLRRLRRRDPHHRHRGTARTGPGCGLTAPRSGRGFRGFTTTGQGHWARSAAASARMLCVAGGAGPGSERRSRARGPSAAVPPVNAEFLQQRLPHSKLDIIDAGHFTWGGRVFEQGVGSAHFEFELPRPSVVRIRLSARRWHQAGRGWPDGTITDIRRIVPSGTGEVAAGSSPRLAADAGRRSQ